ncbi:uncharacterized protein LOC119607192 [Lucilia sericata]|uniref:uncharacterized protein LOC119607192 n=1 Tax=Lucilia sericata TaxID=13632 RepID=UPI0018A80206|nr:uncharacterized protein LOC119607192 [Lucilia sericata]
MDGTRVPTKRELLKIAMAVFDPYGLVADFLLYSKILIQKAWKLQIGWDDPIPHELYKKWKVWWNELKNISRFKVPRCLSQNLFCANIQLHVFVDASQDAFAAVCYFRIQHENECKVAFVMGKIRCAPLKLMSIPRLELQAAVLGVRMSRIIQQNHEVCISSIHFWSDSQTVIQWINSTERRFKAFVSHRIAEILNISTPQQWRHVPSQQNPADAGTRVSLPPKFDNNGIWISGPKYLQADSSSWPKTGMDLPSVPIEEELQPTMVIKRSSTYQMLDYSRFSSFKKLVRTLAWVLRFGRHNFNCELLQPSEISEAEKLLCKMVQHECYLEEITCLQQKERIPKDSTLYPLVPYLDEEGILRIRGRFDEVFYLPFEARRPIIMPQNHLVSELIMNYYHNKNHHQNMNLTINELRQKYWIPHAKSLFKKVKRKCLICKYDTIQPKVPLMGQLPPDRITPFVRPFTYTGVDLFGPFNVSVGRRREKRWAVIFTCLTIRAVHIELADELSTDAFILCFRNFVNRRGTPIRIRSDNGTNFIGAQKLLKKEDRLFDVDKIQEEAINRNIEWLFNCPGNPSSGGVWERLIRIIKRLLSKTLKDTSPKVETLRSLLIEAENILNSRPLTDIPINSDEDEPITPNHFLIGCVNSTQTPSVSDENICLRKQWKIAQNLKDRLWNRWIREYLPQLIQISKWKDKQIPLKIDDIVLIFDRDLPRNQWLKGRIVKVFPAKDGTIRFAEIKTSKGIIRRPASKLAILTLGNGESG